MCVGLLQLRHFSHQLPGFLSGLLQAGKKKILQQEDEHDFSCIPGVLEIYYCANKRKIVRYPKISLNDSVSIRAVVMFVEKIIVSVLFL